MTPAMVDAFHRDGYLVLDGFATDEEAEALMAQTAHIIEAFDEKANQVVFSAAGQSHAASAYFMESASNVSCFLEAGAVDDAGHLIKPKDRAINKIGHALHDLDPVFSAFTCAKIGGCGTGCWFCASAIVAIHGDLQTAPYRGRSECPSGFYLFIYRATKLCRLLVGIEKMPPLKMVVCGPPLVSISSLCDSALFAVRVAWKWSHWMMHR